MVELTAADGTNVLFFRIGSAASTTVVLKSLSGMLGMSIV